MTVRRPSESQHSMTSPGTPMTRLTRCPPVGSSPIRPIRELTGLPGSLTSPAISQPPGSSKTMMSPRSGSPPNQPDHFSTRMRSSSCSPGSIETDGM